MRSTINTPSAERSTQATGLIIFLFTFSVRFLSCAIATAVLHDYLVLSTSLELLILTLLAGQIAGTALSFSRIRPAIGPIGILLIFLGVNGTFFAIQSLFPETPSGILEPYSLLLDVNFFLAIFFFGYVTTWAYWRVRSYATLELLAALLLIITFFAPHRDFNLALAPRVVHTLAWELHTSSFALLIILGGAITLLSILYMGFTSHASIPDRGQKRGQDILVTGHKRPWLAILSAGLLVTLVSLISRQVYSHYELVQESVGTNGVGFAEDEEAVGKSPLGFHSALGSNNQPAAVVRLEGDYQENPTSPMLYLREGALSSFNGTEMVNAGKGFDDDIPGTSAGEIFRAEDRMEYNERVPVPQAIYLLTDHEVVFSIDYPLSIQPLKNPAPQRFRAAYKAYSMAPSYQMSSLMLHKTGNPNWSKQMLDHYLVQHTDTRYSELAHQIVGTETNPAIEASLLIKYLNKKAIYTLTPNHEVKKGDDPVSPFLFGDMRGYCVHFAHAVVYMLRSLGIPARISTGYLTDLSQAKDGHILLRMSDRHAWAEGYFEGYGWVTFDVQPEQVESHADTEIDAQLLEELMGLIGPEDLIIPEDSFEDEPGLKEPSAWELPSTILLLKLMALLLGALYLWKLFLWYGWIFPASPKTRLLRAHRALSTRLADLGHSRHFGETFHEFLSRLKTQAALSPHHTWENFRQMKYAAVVSSQKTLNTSLEEDFRQLASVHRIKRFLSFFNLTTLPWRK